MEQLSQMTLTRDKSMSNEEDDFGALNGPWFSVYFSRLGNTLDLLPCISDAPSSGNKLTSYFLLTLDSDRQIFVLPQDSLLVSTICWPSPSRVSVLLKVFSGTIWLPHIIHNYPFTIRNTSINITTANNAITMKVHQIVKFLAGYIWVNLCWYHHLILILCQPPLSSTCF